MMGGDLHLISLVTFGGHAGQINYLPAHIGIYCQ